MIYIILTCTIMYFFNLFIPGVTHRPLFHSCRCHRTTRRYLNHSVTITLPELILKAQSKRVL